MNTNVKNMSALLAEGLMEYQEECEHKIAQKRKAIFWKVRALWEAGSSWIHGGGWHYGSYCRDNVMEVMRKDRKFFANMERNISLAEKENRTQTLAAYAEYAADQAAKRRARRLAERAGLAYWPAILQAPNTDPRAFVLYEELMDGRGVERWGVNGSYGGWDSMGHYGVTGSLVAQAWYLAGCRQSAKFYWLLNHTEDMRYLKASWSIDQCKRFLKGREFVQQEYWQWSFSTKAVMALGRLSVFSRFAAMHDVPEGTYVRIRDLNWAAVRYVQENRFRPYRMAAVLPKWLGNERIYNWNGVPAIVSRWGREVLEELDPRLIPLKAFATLLEESEDVEGEYSALYTMSRLYSLVELQKMKADGVSLHDMGQFKLPFVRFPQGWREFLRSATNREWLRKSYGMGYLGQMWEQGVLPNKEAIGAWLAEHISKEDLRTQELLLWGVPKYDIRRYLDLYEQPPKTAQFVPHVDVRDGAYRLYQLDHDDLRQPAAGQLVPCCQHLSGEARACARASWYRSDTAIWMVEKEGVPIAMSFVYRGVRDELVLDSIEGKGSINIPKVAELIQKAAEAAIGRLSIKAVYGGWTSYGITKKVRKCIAPERRMEHFIHPLNGDIGYTDADHVFRIA